MTRISENGERAALVTEWVVAIAILVAVMIPLAFAFTQEMKLCRAYYYRAVVLEIIDGEMEVLAAGEWRAFKSGRQTYLVTAHSATNLPPGSFILTLEEGRARLEWQPQFPGRGGPVSREARLK